MLKVKFGQSSFTHIHANNLLRIGLKLGFSIPQLFPQINYFPSFDELHHKVDELKLPLEMATNSSLFPLFAKFVQ